MTLIALRWQPIHSPRRLRVMCSTCSASTVNEDRQLRGWQQSVRVPRVYRCPGCSEVAA